MTAAPRGPPYPAPPLRARSWAVAPAAGAARAIRNATRRTCLMDSSERSEGLTPAAAGRFPESDPEPAGIFRGRIQARGIQEGLMPLHRMFRHFAWVVACLGAAA